MNRLLFAICFCLFAANLNSQTLNTDSSKTQQIKTNNYKLNAETNNRFNIKPDESFKRGELLIPDDLFLLKQENALGNSNIFYSSDLHESTLLLTSSIEYRMQENKKEFMTYLNSIYLQSRPTTMQKIFSTVNFSAGAALAGYYIWKNYLKKK